MTRWFTRSVLIAGASLMFSAAAHAQFVQDFQLNFFVAGTAYTKNNFEFGFPQVSPPVAGTFRMNESIRMGARANVYTGGHWGQEFFYSYEPNQVTLIRRTTPENNLKLDTEVHNLGVNALYYFSDNAGARVRPFASIGLGMTIFNPTADARQIARDPNIGNLGDFDASRELTLNYGTGLSLQMSNVFGIRMDVRGFTSRNPTFGLARQSDNPNAVVLPATGAIHNLEASAGIVFFFQRGR
jgi:hypothetical protein